MELAASCRMIADNGEALRVRGIRAEAMRLSTVWLETLHSPGRSAEDRARRAALLAGLRKRTIQILVKLVWGC